MIFKRSAFGEPEAAKVIAAAQIAASRNGLSRIGARTARYGRPIERGTAEAMAAREPFAAILALESRSPPPPVPA